MLARGPMARTDSQRRLTHLNAGGGDEEMYGGGYREVRASGQSRGGNRERRGLLERVEDRARRAGALLLLSIYIHIRRLCTAVFDRVEPCGGRVCNSWVIWVVVCDFY